MTRPIVVLVVCAVHLAALGHAGCGGGDATGSSSSNAGGHGQGGEHAGTGGTITTTTGTTDPEVAVVCHAYGQSVLACCGDLCTPSDADGWAAACAQNWSACPDFWRCMGGTAGCNADLNCPKCD